MIYISKRSTYSHFSKKLTDVIEREYNGLTDTYVSLSLFLSKGVLFFHFKSGLSLDIVGNISKCLTVMFLSVGTLAVDDVNGLFYSRYTFFKYLILKI